MLGVQTDLLTVRGGLYALREVDLYTWSRLGLEGANDGVTGDKVNL